MQETLSSDGIPGVIQVIETSGQYLDVHPHLHVLITDGLFCDYVSFLKMPRYNEGAYIFLKSLWEKAVANYCIKNGFISKELILLC